MKTVHIVTTVIVSSLLFASQLSAQTPEKIGFEKQIWPILEFKCLKCHQKEHEDNGRMKKPKSGLALDSSETILKGGRTYPDETVVAGKPDSSWLLKTLLLPEDDDLFMPPKNSKLSPEEQEKMKVSLDEQSLIKKWIEEGANFGEWKAKP